MWINYFYSVVDLAEAEEDLEHHKPCATFLYINDEIY